MKRSLFLLLSTLSCVQEKKILIIDGSCEIAGEKDWVYLKVYNSRYEFIEDAKVTFGSFKNIPYYPEMYAYYRESLGMDFMHIYNLYIEYKTMKVEISVRLPQDFTFSFPQNTATWEGIPVKWYTENPPHEWRILLIHEGSEVYSENFYSKEDSTYIPGSVFLTPGEYLLYLYAINYGTLKGDVEHSTFGGVILKKGKIRVIEK